MLLGFTIRVTSVGGLDTVLNILSGLSGSKPLAAKLALMFFVVSACSLAGLYR